MRTTRKQLESMVANIARKKGRPAEEYTKDATGKFVSNVRAIKLDFAPLYGGYAIEEIVNEAGGVTHWHMGRVSASEMFQYLTGYLDALYFVEKAEAPI